MAGAFRILSLAYLVLLAPIAVGYQSSQTGLSSTNASIHSVRLGPGDTQLGGVGFCQTFNPTAPLGCGGAGLGVAFDLTSSGLSPSRYATGTCKIEPESLVPGPYTFLCGTDRDDDTFVTNVDNSPNDAGGLSLDPDGFDDDYALASSGGLSGPTTVSLCLRSDVAFTRFVVEDSRGAVAGDGSWDDVVVYVSQDTVVPPSNFGSFIATLTLNTTSGCTGNVSGHTHG